MATDIRRSQRGHAHAIDAARAVPRTLPNPRVGCVLLRPDGTEIAVGVHRGAGSPHAEIDALTQAGDEAKGATAVVTLEPCNHTGRTGPCTEALIAAGVARVVHAQTDPDPAAAGGAEALRKAGIDVESGVLADEAEALNVEWTHRRHPRPPVRDLEVRRHDGRPQRRARRQQQVDHQRRGAPRRPASSGPRPTRSWPAPARCSPTTRG